MRKAYKAKGVVASGPYSHAVDAGELIFISGQTAMNADPIPTSKGNIAEQTKECFSNLFNILDAANLTEANIVKVNVYLTDMKNFSEMNEVYKTYFSEPYPARTCIAVQGLPLGADLEIEMIAKKD